MTSKLTSAAAQTASVFSDGESDDEAHLPPDTRAGEPPPYRLPRGGGARP
jgi:hypothetical protein